MKALEFRLQGLPPSIWRAYHVTHGGKRVLTEAARGWKEAASWEIRASMGPRRPEPLAGPLAVRVVFFIPSRQRWDLDNHFKLLLDAITESGLWADDSQVVRLDSRIIRKGPSSTAVAIRSIDTRRNVS